MVEYQVATVWWPDGWEPNGPLDVPNCIGWAGEQTSAPRMTYEQGVAAVQGLNRQNMEHPGSLWHVLVSAMGESAGTEAERQVVYLQEGGRGDCSHCPARDFPCAAQEG